MEMDIAELVDDAVEIAYFLRIKTPFFSSLSDSERERARRERSRARAARRR
ncbi:hypothetical protein DPMN_044601 [Dreissena polymorpha]|uniref:Uncharacterized protein n=1 Tax=Dreissena polymorpha TaxID=45954 RepID=A0A9D4D4H3_DREPO|nr:hypothetical protein DPMN_044601 [Dreissena polymorpha]